MLAGGYTAETPVAVVYRATWPDQKIIRSTIATLVQDVKQARISRQALILVGWALAPGDAEDSGGEHRSHLYLPGYKHLFRGGNPSDEAENDTPDTRVNDVKVQSEDTSMSVHPTIGQDGNAD